MTITSDDQPEPRWHRSSFCANSTCVEVALVGEQVAFRDSDDVTAPVLRYTRDEWLAFVKGVKAGEFDQL